MSAEEFVGIYQELITGCALDINKINKGVRFRYSPRRNRRLSLRVTILQSIINELRSEAQEVA